VVHELSTLCVQRTIDTVQNPRGVCALSADDDSSLLALPAHAHAGSVVVHDCLNLHVVCELQCHNSPVAAMALTRDGAMLATASAKGTVIRVHCLPRGDKVWSFRRGVVNAKVRTLAFGGEASTTGEASDDSGEPGAKLLAASSEKGTVHVWRIEGPPRDKSETDIDHEERAFDEEPHHPRECDASHGVLSGVLKGGTKLVGGLLPSGLKRRVHDTWQPTRDAVTVHLPRPANDGSILDRAIGGVASVASTVTSAAAGIGNSRFKPNPEWPGIAGVCALRDGSNPTEVHVVAVNADGLMCEYGADYVTGRVALTRECSVDDVDGAGFTRGGDGTNGGGDGAAVPGGARWLGGGDVGAPGGGRAADLSASVSMSMGQSLFMADPGMN
jgi:autophagy-related protein 18